MARSIGARQVRELTVRRKEGPLLTSLATGDASSKLVEAYRLHPNAIKALARCGQGYSLSDEGLAAESLVRTVASGSVGEESTASSAVSTESTREASG